MNQPPALNSVINWFALISVMNTVMLYFELFYQIHNKLLDFFHLVFQKHKQKKLPWFLYLNSLQLLQYNLVFLFDLPVD